MSDRLRHAPAGLTARPVALSLKDTLRLLRHSVKRGRHMLDDAPRAVPAPLSTVARGALADFDQLADHVNEVAARLSHRFLDAAKAGAEWDELTLAQIETLDAAEIAFAHAAYRALKGALRRLGAENAIVSELRAAEAFKAALQKGEGDRFVQAAHLVIDLIARGAVRGASEPTGTDGAAKAEVANLALVLWLLAERDDDLDGAEDLLDACCAMARALSPDLARTLRLGQPGAREKKLARLIRDYVDNI